MPVSQQLLAVISTRALGLLPDTPYLSERVMKVHETYDLIKSTVVYLGEGRGLRVFKHPLDQPQGPSTCYSQKLLAHRHSVNHETYDFSHYCLIDYTVGSIIDSTIITS